MKEAIMSYSGTVKNLKKQSKKLKAILYQLKQIGLNL